MPVIFPSFKIASVSNQLWNLGTDSVIISVIFWGRFLRNHIKRSKFVSGGVAVGSQKIAHCPPPRQRCNFSYRNETDFNQNLMQQRIILIFKALPVIFKCFQAVKNPIIICLQSRPSYYECSYRCTWISCDCLKMLMHSRQHGIQQNESKAFHECRPNARSCTYFKQRCSKHVQQLTLSSYPKNLKFMKLQALLGSLQCIEMHWIETHFLHQTY